MLLKISNNKKNKKQIISVLCLQILPNYQNATLTLYLAHLAQMYKACITKKPLSYAAVPHFRLYQLR